METLKIFADIIEPEAVNQVYAMANFEAYKNNIIRMMPDCHAGKGSQPDGSGVGTADVLHQLRQLPILLKNFLHFGQHHCPRLRQPDAAPVPAQKNEAVFLFQPA